MNLKKKSVSKLAILIATVAIILVSFMGVKMTGKVVENGKEENPKVLIKTSMGDIIIELYPDKAPDTVNNFLYYTNEGSYDGTVFHRVIPGFMIQGGGFTTEGDKKPTIDSIKLESNNGLKNNAGYVAMARTFQPDSATNQFFINTNNNDFLNYGARDDGYAVFGKVIQGMNIAYKIEKANTTTKNGMTDWPVEDIVIIKVEVIKDFDYFYDPKTAQIKNAKEE